jgi:hypothetical protein
MKTNRRYINKALEEACIRGHLNIVQLLYPMCSNINAAFMDACLHGKLDVAKWLFSMDPSLNIKSYCACDYESEDIFCKVCSNGYLDMAKWLWDQFKPYCPNAFINSCKYLDVVKWLLSICPDIDVYEHNDMFLIVSCVVNSTNTVAWIVENYYKSHPYIKIDEYDELEREIQDILIEYNLIDPATLNESDLDLQKINRFLALDGVKN